MDVATLLSKAIAAHQGGDLAEAGQLYQKAVTRDPSNIQGNYLLGSVLLLTGKPAQGLKHLEKALRLKPDLVPALVNRATALVRLGRLEEAVASYDQALALKPDNAIGWNARGNALQKLKKLPEALQSTDRAIALKPANAEFHFNRAQILGLLERYTEALTANTKSLSLDQNSARTWCAQGILLHQLARYDEALAMHEKALALDPALLAALNAKGNALRALHRPEEALQIHEQAIAREPVNAQYHLDRAVALLSLGEVEKGIASANRALKLDPKSPDAVYNRSLIRLLAGDFPEAWRDYEARWQSSSFPSKPSPYKAPHWDGTPLNGCSLLVFAEQGIGDIIQFSRFLPWLSHAGGPVRFAAPPSMHWMFAAYAPAVLVESNVEVGNEPDFQIALMTLPARAETTLETIPPPLPLTESLALVAPRQANEKPTKSVRVGLCWSGSQQIVYSFDRFMALATLAPLASLEGVVLVSLREAKDNAREAETLATLGIETLGDAVDRGPDAFIDTAAAILGMDLVITVDTAIGHLAGSLGVPVWLMLKKVPDWRWLQNRSDSPWYPSARLFRQKNRGDWEPVIAEIAEALTNLAAEKASKA